MDIISVLCFLGAGFYSLFDAKKKKERNESYDTWLNSPKIIKIQKVVGYILIICGIILFIAKLSI